MVAHLGKGVGAAGMDDTGRWRRQSGDGASVAGKGAGAIAEGTRMDGIGESGRSLKQAERGMEGEELRTPRIWR